jgi:glucan phosphoethanolaminetransferase (alkaline phosphatase superfamily)
VPENLTIEIADEIIKILDYLGEKFGMMIDYTTENVIPEVTKLCEKYIAWQISTSIAWIVIAVLVFLISLIVAIKVSKQDWSDGFEWICLICIGVVAMIIIGKQTFDIIEAITFPEKSIYDYIQFCKEWG